MPTIYNKVVIDGSTLMDISDTTAVAADVASGKYFYTANGTKTAGTASSGGSSEDQTVTGTVTGDGTTILQIPCSFEPDIIYVYGDMSDDVTNRGIVSVSIIKDTVLCVSADSSTSSSEPYGSVFNNITGYNESDTENIHATYTNGTLTIDAVQNTSSSRFPSGQVYNYELSTIGTSGSGGSASVTEVQNQYGTELVIVTGQTPTPEPEPEPTPSGNWVTVLDDNVTVWDDSTIIEDLVDMELTNGDTYRTTIDGTAYISEAQLHPQWGAVYFGNVNIWDEVDDGTGLPFCAHKTTYGLKFMLRDGGNSTHALKIERQVNS